jgi:aldose 1-epimerase
MSMSSLLIESYGNLPDGRPVHLFTLQNSNVQVQVTNYGARIVSLWVPDRTGAMDNIVLDYTCLEHYLKGHQYLGATIGRVANRIGNGKFELEGQTYNLTKNLGNHHLHGGNIGFESCLWDIAEFQDSSNPWVEFQLTSYHGDQGYPGNVIIKVRYSINEDNSLEISMSAISDRPTIINLTNHAYFNLSGGTLDNIYGHKAQIFASNFLKVNHDSIPTGEIQNVENSVIDFRQSTEIGLGISQKVDPVINTNGFDQFFVSDCYQKGKISKMVEIYEPGSGRVLGVASTLPGFQFYTSNFLNAVYPASNGKTYGKHSAICIEPSYFTDAPNHNNFQSIRLNRGDFYNETIVYSFRTN